MLRTAWRSLLHHSLRLALSGLAIVLGVGFVVGTLIFTDTLNNTFTNLFEDTTSDVVVTPAATIGDSNQIGTVATMPAATLDTVRAVSGVAKATGVVLGDGITVIDADGAAIGTQGAPRFGANWEDDQELTPFRLVEGRGPSGPDEVALDSVSAQKGGYGVGDEVALVGPDGPFSARLAGIFRYGTSGNLAGATIAAFDTPQAQQLVLGGADAFTEVDAIAASGVGQDTLAAAVSSALGDVVTVRTGQQAADEAAAAISEGLAFVNVFLLVFAGIALFVGTFIILNTFSMLVAQRSQELALLRAIGATRGQVTRSLVVESALVGLAGSLVGIGVGVAVAFGLQGLFAAIGAEIPTDGLVVSPRTIAVGLIVGVVATVLAALAPALRASRIAPMAALRDDATLPSRSLRLRAVVGSVLLVAGVAAMAAGAATGSDGAPLVGIGVVVALIGTIVVSPAIARPLVRTLGFAFPRLFGTVGRLALENAERQPRRTAATASALMIGLALVSALTIFAMSAKASITAVIDRVIGAEFIVSNGVQRTPIAASTVDALSGVPGVAAVSPVASVPAEIDGSITAVVAIDPASFGRMVAITTVDGSLADLGTDGIAIDTGTAASSGLSIGDPVAVRFVDGSRDFRVAAVFESAGEFGGYVASRQAVTALGMDPGDRVIYVKAEPGADLAQVQADLEAAVADDPTVQVQSQAQFAQEITSNVDQVLLVMVMLLSLAVLIAVLGIVNTLVLSVAERTREIGMLRAVGALRRQVRTMIVLEALVIAVFGAVVGLGLGVGFAVALQRTLVDQGITELDIPWVGLVLFLVVAGLVGVLAAVWPAFRAGRLNVLRAIATE